MSEVVIGLGFGDEGKGLVTDWRSSQIEKPVVKRYSGGHQAGHCVRTLTEKHIFSNFGSGTMRGAPTIWNAKTVDPVGFMNEYKLIKKWNPIIQIDPLCPVTTPWDKIANRDADDITGHGSVGVGFGSTIGREEANVHLYFHDLFYPWVLKNKVMQIRKFYGNIDTDYSIIKEFYSACADMIKIVSTDEIECSNAIYESSQGILLDMDYGIFPHVTRSKLGTQEIKDELDDDTEFYLVTRGYQTRHGNGPCNTLYYNAEAKDETNSSEGFQGAFKERVLDLDVLKYAITIDPMIRESKNRNLVITCLDQMPTYEVSCLEHGLVTFNTEEEYLNFIIDFLPEMKYIYISHGGTAKDITLYKRS